jgi:hypothetical protein
MVAINIDKSIANINSAETKKQQDRTKPQPGAFDAVFRQTMDAKETKGTESPSTPFMTEIRPAQFTAATGTAPSAHIVANQVEALIDTMEAYQQKLGDSHATLKDIQPLMEKMASHNKRLSAISKTVGDQEGLGSVVNQSLMLSSMEIARYNSGFYNN